MSIEKSCFLSYRHRPAAEHAVTIKQFHETLESELQLRLNLESYFDPNRTPSDFVTEALASTLCKSACMVVLYIPLYFDPTYKSCAREYKAMEELEESRMTILGHTDKKKHGLIVPVIYRGYENFPERIKSERTCYNIEPFTLGKRIRNSAKAKAAIGQIAEYICDRYMELQRLDEPEGQKKVAELKAQGKLKVTECSAFRYPEADRISAWLTTLQVAHSPDGLPHRSHSTN